MRYLLPVSREEYFEDMWAKHQEQKNKARQEKIKDKEESLTGSVNVVTMDLQAVKVSPFFNGKCCKLQDQTLCS